MGNCFTVSEPPNILPSFSSPSLPHASEPSEVSCQERTTHPATQMEDRDYGYTSHQVFLSHSGKHVMELKRKGFVEGPMGIGPGLYIHDLLMEFAAHKADGRGKWISLKERDEIPAGLQEAPSTDRPRFLVLHLQHMPRLKSLNLSPMRIVRSITIVGCRSMEEIKGLENLTSLAYFLVDGCSANLRLSGIERLVALQLLEVHAGLQETLQSGCHFFGCRSVGCSASARLGQSNSVTVKRIPDSKTLADGQNYKG